MMQYHNLKLTEIHTLHMECADKELTTAGLSKCYGRCQLKQYLHRSRCDHTDAVVTPMEPIGATIIVRILEPIK